MACYRGHSLSKRVGPRDLSRLFRIMHDGVVPPDGYILIRDMVTRATDESVPL